MYNKLHVSIFSTEKEVDRGGDTDTIVQPTEGHYQCLNKAISLETQE